MHIYLFNRISPQHCDCPEERLVELHYIVSKCCKAILHSGMPLFITLLYLILMIFITRLYLILMIFNQFRFVYKLLTKMMCYIVLQPRIFILLRRCLYDNDDEVLNLYIEHRIVREFLG